MDQSTKYTKLCAADNASHQSPTISRKELCLVDLDLTQIYIHENSLAIYMYCSLFVFSSVHRQRDCWRVHYIDQSTKYMKLCARESIGHQSPTTSRKEHWLVDSVLTQMSELNVLNSKPINVRSKQCIVGQINLSREAS